MKNNFTQRREQLENGVMDSLDAKVVFCRTSVYDYTAKQAWELARYAFANGQAARKEQNRRAVNGYLVLAGKAAEDAERWESVFTNLYERANAVVV